MPSNFRLSARELLILLLVIAAAATAITFLAKGVRDSDENYCIALDGAAAAVVAGEQLRPDEAFAAADPWIAERAPAPFEHYYVIAMRVRTSDGATLDGLWGVGTNNDPPAPGQRLWFDPEHSVVTALDSAAADHSGWPVLTPPFEDQGTAASRARECLIG